MEPSHGIRANLGRHALLVINTAFIGTMVGLERTVVPLLAKEEFGVESAAVTLSFIAAFGAVKAAANFAAGRLADRFGRKRLLVLGWLVGLPVPLLVIAAPAWGWVIGANLLLGASQGLTWTMTLTMMGDLAGGRRRGLAMGANEFTGYVAIALAAWLSAAIASSYGLRPAPFLPGVVAALAGLASSLVLRDTFPHTRIEQGSAAPPRWILFPGRVGPGASLLACYQAGHVTKIIDAGVWGLLPLLLKERGFDLPSIGLVVATYPLVWGVSQAATGALSDRLSRRRLIAWGMRCQAAGLVLLVAFSSFSGALAAAVVLGAGTALAYPTLLALVGDLASARWRASAMGAYRFWRDLGFVVGALGIGAVADAAGRGAAILGVAAASLVSGAVAHRWIPEPAEPSEPRESGERLGPSY
ncbi:MAG: MFS transporter [Actinomycetota bacterium]